jgi:phosphoglycerol transferase MdoB-like AlkP superfamily enzyme
MMLYRVLFFFSFAKKSHIEGLQWQDLSVIGLGLIFDNIIASYFSAIPILLVFIISFLPGQLINRLVNSVLKSYYFFALLFLVFLCLTDFRFYAYFQDHLNLFVFNFFDDDTKAIIFSFITESYTFVAFLIFGLTLYLLFKGIKKITFIPRRHQSTYLERLFLLLLIPLIAIGSRGGIGKFPLSTSDANITREQFYNLTTINPAMAFYQAFKARMNLKDYQNDITKHLGYRGRELEAIKTSQELLGIPYESEVKTIKESLFQRQTTPVPSSNRVPKPHVVVNIMESFSNYWFPWHSDQFNILGEFKKHLDRDYYFNNFLPADNGTIGSLVSLMIDQPMRPNTAVVSESEFFNVPLSSAVTRPYKKMGYKTVFIYAGKKGWRNIHKYLALQGFDQVIGERQLREDYQLRPGQYNAWGVADEFMFQKALEILKQSTQPIFLVNLSMSNHPPFYNPLGYQPLPLEIPKEFMDKKIRSAKYLKERFLGYQYASDQLGRFISSIKNNELLSARTILAATGDHTFKDAIHFDESELFLSYTVPFYLRPLPGQKISIDPHRPASHESLFPTLLNLALGEEQLNYISFGQNLLKQSSNHCGFNIDKFIACDNGLIINDQFYLWKDKSRGLIKKVEENADYQELKKIYDSHMVAVDQYLKLMLKNRP